MLSPALLAITASGAAAGCPAPFVHEGPNRLMPRPFNLHSRWIAPEPRKLLAVMWSGRAVDGRFSVYAGGRNPVTGINEKIMWVVPARATGLTGTRLKLVWLRAGRRHVQVNQGYPGRRQQRISRPRIYPSILKPPAPGCWKLRIRIGRIRSTMHVIVQPPPRR